MPKDRFVAEQGHGLGRPGEARVTRVGSADNLQGVRVAGKGFVLMRGSVDLPDHL
jgi:predicted PhzF superfamily epimerase YddE/YHI9